MVDKYNVESAEMLASQALVSALGLLIFFPLLAVLLPPVFPLSRKSGSNIFDIDN